MVALGVTLVSLAAIVLIIVPSFIRPHYETPLSYKMPLVGSEAPTSSNNSVTNSASLVLNQAVVNSQNQPLDWANPPSSCIKTTPAGFNTGRGVRKQAAAPGQNGSEVLASQNGGPVISMNCLASLGYQTNTEYQPSYRYWDFQRIETALYLGLAAIPIAAAYWLVLKRDA
jgi:hypothetical protein